MGLILLTVLGLLACSVSSGSGAEFFTNPVLGDWTSRINPNVIQINSKYYLSLYENETESISIHESSKLTDFRNASKKVVETKIPNVGLYAGPMHIIDGELYLYFVRSYPWWEFPFYKKFAYAIKAVNASDPMGEWEAPELLDWPWIMFEDLTIMEHGDKKYFIWTESTLIEFVKSIYITEMVTPTQMSNNSVIIRGDNWEGDLWDCYAEPFPPHKCIRRFSQIIYGENRSYMVFTGYSKPFSEPKAALSYMSIDFDKDPMDADNWNDAGGPLFGSNEEEDVFNPGFATFVKSPDKTETWMIYTADSSKDRARLGEFRLEKMEWDDSNGEPIFPKAHGFSHPQRHPSGQISE